MIGKVATKDGQKVVEPISGSIPVGNPVGTLLSRANGQVPRNYLECDGSTFNEGHYPALYLYLGTNVLPTYFDHSRLGAWENIEFPLNTEVTMPYDGVVVVGRNGTYASMIKVIRGNSEMEYGGSANISGVLQTIEITVQKGDILKTTHNSWDYHKVAYYKHHLYIKAVDGVDISNEDTFLDTVKNFVQEKNSYSTTEMLTGGKWIDGKPIYRKVVDFAFSSNSTVSINLGDVAQGWVDFTHSYVYGSYGTRQPWKLVDTYISNGTLYFTTSHSAGNVKMVYEYTKTTD